MTSKLSLATEDASNAENPNGEKGPEVPLDELQSAAEADPDNVDKLREYARGLMHASRFDDALECWFHIERLRPEEGQPGRMIAKLIIAKNRYRALHGQLPEPVEDEKKKKKRRNASADPTEFDTTNLYRAFRKRRAQAPRQIELTDWQRLQRQIDETPGKVELYLELADYYLHEDREYDAEKTLQKGLEPTGNDPVIRQRWEEVTLHRSQRKLEIAERRASIEDTDSAKQGLVDAQKNHEKLVHEVYISRCEREPENTATRYEFGMHLKRAGQHEAACVQLEQALTDPQRKAAANLAIGECLQRSNKFAEALQHYRHAVQMAGDLEQTDYKKLALYRAGTLASGIKLLEPAKRYLSELVRLDPLYRDAAAKLNEID